METELRTSYDTKKSFYGKAKVRYEGDKLILRSYQTDVAYIENGKATVNGSYSSTTLRHIKEFLKQNGFKADTWAQIKNDYSKSKEEEAKEREEEEERASSFMKSVSMVAKLGEVMTDTKKDANDWKARMLKAGLDNKGLSMPEDWETLSEVEKEKRLNKVIAVCGN